MSVLDIALSGGLLAGRAAYLYGPQGRPRNNRIASIGDSLTYLNWHNTPSSDPATVRTMQSRGWQFWAQTLSGGKVLFSEDATFGISGQTSTQILARIPAALAATDAGAFTLLATTNDRTATNDLSLQTSKDNVTAAISLITGAGRLCFLIIPPPIGFAGGTGGVTGYPSANQIKTHMACIEWMRRVASRMPGVVIVDAFANLVDPADASAGFNSTVAGPSDTAHFGTAGAYYIGKAFADQVNVIYPAPGFINIHSADVYDATYNPAGNMITNGAMTGTAGTQSAGGSTMSGQVATSWSLTGSSATGLTVVASKVTSGQRTMQQLVISGTPSADTSYIELAQNISAAYAQGESVSGQVWVEVDAGSSGVRGIVLDTRVQDTGSASTNAAAGYQSSPASVFYPSAAWSGLVIAPALPIPAGPNNLRTRLRVFGQGSQAISLTVRFGEVSLRKS